MPVSVNRSISSVTTDALPDADALEQIAIGNEGDALPPRPVVRREMRRHVVVGAEYRARTAPSSSCFTISGSVERAAGEHVLLVQDLAAHDLVDPRLVDLQLPQRLGELDRRCGRC